MNEARFRALWARCVPDPAAAAPGAVYAELRRRYSEPHRHYHTGRHIDRCLGQLDQASDLMDDPDAVEMALWFHDAVYEPQASDNEWQSAHLFLQRVGHYAAPAFARKVHDLILATTHREPARCRDERFIVDIDLAGFGLPWEAFVRDGEAVRAEYLHLPDAEFYAGLLQFLSAFLARPAFFQTDFFRARYEQIAQENLRRRIAELRAQGYG